MLPTAGLSDQNSLLPQRQLTIKYSQTHTRCRKASEVVTWALPSVELIGVWGTGQDVSEYWMVTATSPLLQCCRLHAGTEYRMHLDTECGMWVLLLLSTLQFQLYRYPLHSSTDVNIRNALNLEWMHCVSVLMIGYIVTYICLRSRPVDLDVVC